MTEIEKNIIFTVPWLALLSQLATNDHEIDFNKAMEFEDINEIFRLNNILNYDFCLAIYLFLLFIHIILVHLSVFL